MAHPRDAGRPKVGVIGLGRMGTALAQCLLRAGYSLRCHDRDPHVADALSAAGATTAPNPRALAASCDVVITFLPGPTQVREVALDVDRGVLAGLSPESILLDMSTCGPDTAELVGGAFDAAGRRFLDCPVSRTAPNMTVLVGGEPGALGRAEKVLEPVSRTIQYCGRRGAGYATKLLNQHVKYAWYLASAEAMLIAQRFGLDPAATATAIEKCSGGESGLSAAAEYFRDDIDAIRSHAPASTIEKDVNLAREMAAQVGVHGTSLDAMADFFTAVGETSYRDRPYPESTELLCELRTSWRVSRDTP
jgi:3-hydroxyisobutyrate dehydrogenase-like beta-hydroxyacid dehydrogenase